MGFESSYYQYNKPSKKLQYKKGDSFVNICATEELLQEWIFEKKKAEVIFAVEDGVEVGFALFFHNFSTFYFKVGDYDSYLI